MSLHILPPLIYLAETKVSILHTIPSSPPVNSTWPTPTTTISCRSPVMPSISRRGLQLFRATFFVIPPWHCLCFSASTTSTSVISAHICHLSPYNSSSSFPYSHASNHLSICITSHEAPQTLTMAFTNLTTVEAW